MLMDFCGPRRFQRRQQESWDFLAVELLGGFRQIVTSDAIGSTRGRNNLRSVPNGSLWWKPAEKSSLKARNWPLYIPACRR